VNVDWFAPSTRFIRRKVKRGSQSNPWVLLHNSVTCSDLYRRIHDLVRQQSTCSQSDAEEEQSNYSHYSIEGTPYLTLDNRHASWGERSEAVIGPDDRRSSISVRDTRDTINVLAFTNSQDMPSFSGIDSDFDNKDIE